MQDVALQTVNFIDLNITSIIFLFIVGFIGGLVSGFIGSGGAFVLTPGMMSLGVPGTVAVASNMCHKFPKALVGAIKRYKYGQVDIKLGLVMAASAGFGVQVGIKIQEWILATWGQAGSNLYVSLSFVAVLIIVGGYVFYDAWKTSRAGGEEKTPALALWLQSINLPPMVTFKTAKSQDFPVVHHSHRFCHRSAGGHHRGGRLCGRAGHDLCSGGLRSDSLGHGTGDRFCHGFRRQY